MREGKKAARMLYLVTAGLKENPKGPAGGGGGGHLYHNICSDTRQRCQWTKHSA